MMTYHCTACWSELPAGAVGQPCAWCGAATDAPGDYVDKLLQALRHPEPSTPVRAASILGQLGARRAVGPLLAVLRTSHDGFLLAAAARALGQIGDPAAVPGLVELLRHGPLPARLAAVEALRRLGGAEAETALRWAARADPARSVREAAGDSIVGGERKVGREQRVQ